jgi:hypothetical protein
MGKSAGVKLVIFEIFIALLKVGLPVGLTSYGLVWWALKKEYIEPVDDLKSFELEVKKRAKDKKLKKEGDHVHRKWLAFGGGFYGVVALLTWVIVETMEVVNVVLHLGGIFELIRNISFALIINLFVGALRNFVIAIAWPFYWLSEIQSDFIWAWFIVAYGAYWVGSRLALRKIGLQKI